MTNWHPVTVRVSLDRQVEGQDTVVSIWRFKEGGEELGGRSGARFQDLLARFSQDVIDRVAESRGDEDAARDELEQLGAALFAALVPKDGTSIAKTIAGLLNQEAGVRILLHLVDAELERLPWELTRTGDWLSSRGANAAQGINHLALTPGISIVRTGDPYSGGPSAGNTSCPLSLVVVDAGSVGAPARRLSGASRSNMGLPEELDPIELRAEKATFDGLRERLRKSRCNAVHFTGHGVRGDDERNPRLEFARRGGGEPDPVGLNVLGDDLGRAEIQLAVIAACYTGTDRWWSGSGATLLQHVPAVVSLQAAAFDRRIDAFTGVLYRELANGSTLDDAVARARRSSAETNGLGDWWLAVLHSRAAPFGFASVVREHRIGDPSVHLPSDEGPAVTNGSQRPRPWQPSPSAPGVLPAEPVVLSCDGQICLVPGESGSFQIGTLRRLERTVTWWPAARHGSSGAAVAVQMHPFDAEVLITDTKHKLVRFVHVDQQGRTRELRAPVDGDVKHAAWTGAGFTWINEDGTLASDDVAFRAHLPERAQAFDAAIGDGELMAAWLDGGQLIVTRGRCGSDLRFRRRAHVDGNPEGVQVARDWEGTPQLALVQQGPRLAGWLWDDLEPVGA